MSTGTPSATRRSESDAARGLLPEGVSGFRVVSLVAVLVLTGTYVSVLWDVARVVGGSGFILPIVVVVLVASTLLAQYIDARVAGAIGVVLAVLGYAYYLTVTPGGIGLALSQADAILADALALFTGLPILRMIRADVWALAYVPGPVFFSWYLVMRRRYVASVAVGGAALSFLVLTSDAGTVVTLAGVLAGIAAIGFGELDRRNGTLLQADVLVILVALVLVTSVGASTLAGSGANPLNPSAVGIGGGSSTVEGTLVGASNRAPIVGSISLSPEVRFTVEADEERYWRTGVYDRYTGQGWIRTGRTTPYEGRLEEPVGPRRTLVQTYTAESRVATMPAAADPVRVTGTAADHTVVTNQGNVQPRSTFIEGDKYRVYSRVSTATPEMLRLAERDYPDAVEERYTELPDDTPDRVGERTARIVEPADNPYDTAVLVEQYLEENKGYSLEVDRPGNHVADSFLFEMDEGYCTYFATTMVVMLRSQGIPARMAVGYTPGQQVSEDEWVVRGLNSHAWVEVYFPEYGWIQFDPTPGGPRQNAELDAVEEARESGDGGNVDTDQSEDAPLTPTTTTTAANATTTTVDTNVTVGPRNRTLTLPPFAQPNTAGNVTGNVTNGTSPNQGNDGPLPSMPSTQDTVLGGMLLLAAVAGAHRYGLTDSAYQSARMRWQRTGESPERDVERAYERLEILLSRRYRDRKPGETPRQYMDSLSIAGLDPRARRVLDAYERARYAGTVSRGDADAAVGLVDDMVGETTPILGRFRR